MPFFDNEFYASRFHKEPEYLPWIFKWMMDRDFDYSKEEDKRVMQVAMLILQTRGLSIAEYSWDLFSTKKLLSWELQDDLYAIKNRLDKVDTLSKEYMNLIKELGAELKGKSAEFIECLGALYSECWHYYRSKTNKSETIKRVAKLLKLKPTDPVLDEAWKSVMKFIDAW